MVTALLSKTAPAFEISTLSVLWPLCKLSSRTRSRAQINAALGPATDLRCSRVRQDRTLRAQARKGMRAAQGKMSVSNKGIHACQLWLAGADCKDESDNENDVELQFARSRQPCSSAPIRLGVYRCLMF